jgi:hypothetical protein
MKFRDRLISNEQSILQEAKVSKKDFKENMFENDIKNWITMWFSYLNNDKALELYKETERDMFQSFQRILSNKNKAKQELSSFIEVYSKRKPKVAKALEEIVQDDTILDLIGQYAAIDSRTGGSNFLEKTESILPNGLASEFKKFGIK